MYKLGYSEAESNKIKGQVQYYSDLRETIKQAISYSEALLNEDSSLDSIKSRIIFNSLLV